MQSLLVSKLVEIFPTFQQEWNLDNDKRYFTSDSLHSVWQSFLPYISSIEISEKQVKVLCRLIDQELNRGGTAENAVDTCFLEHAHQVKISKRIKEHASIQIKNRLRA